MKKLNLRTPKKFDYTDEAGTVPPKVCFCCISEGPTEESYFFGVRNNKAKLRIKNVVHIEVVEKEKWQETFSHPLQLVKAALVCMGRIDENKQEISADQWKEYCKWENFHPEVDPVCVVFDRDCRDLDEKKEEIFRLCDKHGIKVVLSNPNFELWLLMHFPDIGRYPREKLLNNEKNLRGKLFEGASKNKKYLEILVAQIANGYSKGEKLKFEKFCDRVDLAIEQAKGYCEESKRLMFELGTSMGRLIEKMRSQQ